MTKAYSIVGINHTRKEAYVAALKGGEDVVLVREPDNPFDPLAVAVWIGGERIGYVPKKQNQALAQFIDQQGTQLGKIEGFATPQQILAQDTRSIPAVMSMAIRAKFVRSPNSGFPLVEV